VAIPELGRGTSKSAVSRRFVATGLRGGAGEHPQANAIIINAQQIREVAYGPVRIGA
jgi:hypothetical protein